MSLKQKDLTSLFQPYFCLKKGTLRQTNGHADCIGEYGVYHNIYTRVAISRFRHFSISSVFGVCASDEGWLVVLDAKDSCRYTLMTSYPAFRYALGSQKQLWANRKSRDIHAQIS